jgi:hypothetical protein
LKSLALFPMSRRLWRALSGRRDKYSTSAQRSGQAARTLGSIPSYWKRDKIMRWHQIAKPDRVFSMMIAEVLFVGRWQTAHSFSLPNRLMPRFGVRRRIFDDESHHTIDLSERFLRRRFSGCLDHLLTADLFRPFLKRFVLITIDATCHSLARIHLELPWRFDLGSFYVFQIDGCS